MAELLPVTIHVKHEQLPTPRFVTIPELAEILRRSPESVRQACHRGDVPGAIQVGRLWRINLDAFLAASGSPPQAA